jgi:hypothetical protein
MPAIIGKPAPAFKGQVKRLFGCLACAAAWTAFLTQISVHC